MGCEQHRGGSNVRTDGMAALDAHPIKQPNDERTHARRRESRRIGVRTPEARQIHRDQRTEFRQLGPNLPKRVEALRPCARQEDRYAGRAPSPDDPQRETVQFDRLRLRHDLRQARSLAHGAHDTFAR